MNVHGESSGSSSIEGADGDQPTMKRPRWQIVQEQMARFVNDNTEEDVSSDDDSVQEARRNDINLHAPKYCCIESFLSTAENIFDAANHQNQEVVLNEGPEGPDERNLELYRLQWHTKQMARCYIDNKINSSLEAYFGSGGTDLEQDLDISDIVEEAESDAAEVDDEGITMAIELHGLKTNYNLNCDPSNSTENCKGVSELNSNLPNSSTTKEYEEVNSNDFLDTAVSVAIFEKGLVHPNQ